MGFTTWMCLASIACAAAAAQSDSFSVFRFSAAPGWQVSRSADKVTLTRAGSKQFCQIALLPAVPSTGAMAQDFQTDWDSLIRKQYRIQESTPPEKGSAPGGWATMFATAVVNASGTGSFASVLRTYSGSGVRATVLVNVNHDGCTADLKAFFDNLRLQAGEAQSSAAAAPTSTPAGGWTAGFLADHVRMTKDGIAVSIFHAIPLDDQLRNGDILENFWRLLVAPSYSARTKNVAPYEATGHGGIRFATAKATDAKSGANAFTGLSVFISNGIAYPVMAAARDEATFRSYAARPEDLNALRSLNSFNATRAQIAGRWTSSFSSAAETYYVATGNFAGVQVAAASLNIAFEAPGQYRSETQAVNGKIGNLAVQTGVETGSFDIQGNELTLRPPGKDPTVYVCVLEAVRGGMMLRLVNKRYSGLRWDLLRAK